MVSERNEEIPDMAENQTDETQGDEPKGLPEVRAALERETKRRKDIESQLAEAQQAQRDLTFVRAGVDLDSKLGQLFAKAYDGEMDADAIKSSFGELTGTGQPPAEGQQAPPSAGPPQEPPPANEGLTQEQLNQLAQGRAGLTSNATPPGAEPSAPVFQAAMDAAFAAQGGQRVRPSGGMGHKARDAAFDVIFKAASEGNPDAVFKAPGESWADATDRWRQGQ